jgi:hypothetical protein
MWLIDALMKKEIALQVDLAAAAVALVALLFSIWSWRNQKRINIETIRIQRDNDVINWTNTVIDLLVAMEFLLRDGRRHHDANQFGIERDAYLARLSASIDKGRLYFPNYDHDVYGTEKESAYRGHRQPILDRLVEIYDLSRDANVADAAALEKTKQTVGEKKRAFISEAQSEVEPRRRVLFLKAQRQ